MRSREIKFWLVWALVVQVVVLGGFLFCHDVYVAPFMFCKRPPAEVWDWYRQAPHPLPPAWKSFWISVLRPGRLPNAILTLPMGPAISRAAHTKETRLPIPRRQVILVDALWAAALALWCLVSSALEHYPLALHGGLMGTISLQLLAFLWLGTREKKE